MSIAVSAVVARSRRLSGVVAGMCVCVAVAGFTIAAGLAGDLSVLEKGVLAGMCLLIAAYVFFRTVRIEKTCEIHVSGTGQIRLRKLLGDSRAPVRKDAEHSGARLPDAGYSVNQHGELVRLLPASTLWSWLLILHLRHENGRNSILTILPDAVGEESFRALLVACRWIATRRAEDTR
ncbi:MAG TPA: protein YgfX [Oxalicibacterium sp.]|nr:protein YgfX [Oxalicibacterium sp.]